MNREWTRGEVRRFHAGFAANLEGVRFETFELILKTGELRKGGVKIRLQEHSYQILAALLGCPAKPASGSGSGACRWRTENTGEISVVGGPKTPAKSGCSGTPSQD